MLRSALFAATRVAAQMLVPAAGQAQQVDPCRPVPLPELCDLVPTPAPAPTPEPDPGTGDDDTKGSPKEGDRSDRSGKGRARLRPMPFRMGGPESTLRLVSILSGLPRYGVPLSEALLEVSGPFPVAGLSWWANDWHACRDGCRRLHQGLDMFARHGTPLVAIADGVVTSRGNGGLAGMSVEITDHRGVQYFYAHLSGWAPGIEKGTAVRKGQVLGYVGNTGNAASTPPHLPLEVQPGGKPVPPKPRVDRWLEDAERRAIDLVVEVTGKPPAGGRDFRTDRLLDVAGPWGAGAGAPPDVLLLAGLQPSLPTLHLAQEALGVMAWEIDWEARAEAELAALGRRARRWLADPDPTAGLVLGFGMELGQAGSTIR